MKRLYHRAKAALRPKALVLMYHRIAVLESDVWDIAVSPKHFEEQLQVLQKSGKVVSLASLVADIKTGSVRRGSIALTFDDGYLDNFTAARPLLEKYQIPATFFITTGNLGQQKEFWWDELEQLLLFTPELPHRLTLSLGGQQIDFDFGAESQLTKAIQQAHQHWKASSQPPPGLRASNYLHIWQLLKPLPHPAQQEKMQELRDWAGAPRLTRTHNLSMSPAQLQELAASPLFDVGIHTLTHPALACHDAAYQYREISGSRQFLQDLLGNSLPGTSLPGNPLNLLAYPFGINNADTLAVVAEQQLLAAFTTKEEPVSAASHPYRLGRFQVKDWSGNRFGEYVQQWSKI